MKKYWICSFILITILAFAYGNDLRKIEVANAIDRKAICNDGTPATYYYAPGSDSGVNRWVIVLNGGGRQCVTIDEYWPDEGCWGGVLSPDFGVGDGILSNNSLSNPDFYNANRIFIQNCSYDNYIGNSQKETPRTYDGVHHYTVQFRGRKILRSIISDLRHKTSPNLDEKGIEVLLVGQGAQGGVGAINNIDWLAKKLKDAGRVRGVNDAGWFIESFDAVHDGTEPLWEQGIVLWKGKVDASCKRANKSQQSRCFSDWAYQYLSTPLFVESSQADYHVNDNKYAKLLRDSLIPVGGAFCPKTETGRISDRFQFWAIKVNGYSFADVLGNWFFDRSGPVKVIDTK